MLQKQLKIMILLSLGTGNLFGQYQGVSPYFTDPSLSIGYVDSCAQFWMNTLDETRGGFYTNIDREGNVISAWGTNKNLLTQTRNAYGFARAYMMTGNDVYREYAEAGLDFMYEHAWDPTHGGWYSQLDANGNVQGATNGRSAFDAHYALLGPAAAFEAFGDSLDLEMLTRGYDHLETVYWDDREGFSGYADWATYTGTASYNKSFNATVDAITTHLLARYQQTGDPLYLDRMHEICQQIIDHFVTSMSQQNIGFVEEYDSNWNWDNGETMTIMGHVLKAAWCLVRVYHIDPVADYLDAAEVLMNDVLDQGYDHDFGGPYKDYNRETGEMLMWGNPDTAKAWWQMEQAITAGYSMWSITGEENYLQIADESLHFFMRYFVDHTYGDIYENRTRYGAETWGLNKGGGGKAAYHSIETGYYNYIYNSLYVQDQPFSLHYWFEPLDSSRSIELNPVKSSFYPLAIQTVELDGVNYTDFETRSLLIPGSVGGEFKVTFARVSQTSIDAPPTPDHVVLSQAWPNPFNGTTRFTLKIDQPAHARVTIHDVRGRQIRIISSGMTTPGELALSWDGLDNSGQPVSTGVYMIQSRVHNQVQNQKVLLLK